MASETDLAAVLPSQTDEPSANLTVLNGRPVSATPARNPQASGAADLDGTQFGTVVHSGLGKPMMLLASQSSCITGTCRPSNADEQSERDAARALLAASAGPVWSYRLDGAAHVNFSDYGAYYVAAPIRAVVGLGSIDGDEALTIANAYLAAFVDHVARGLADPLLGPSSPYAQVEVQRTAS